MDARMLDIGETVRFAWERTRTNLGLLVGLTVVAGISTIIPSSIAEWLQQPSPGLSALFRLIAFIISMLVSVGGVRIGLKIHDGQPVAVRDLFTADWSLFWRYVVASFLYSLVFGIGLILLVIPGIILGVRYFFYGYFVLERGARPVQSLAQSAAATAGVRWDVFLFIGVLLLLVVLGAILLGVGLLVTVPMAYIAAARAYRMLTKATPTAAPSGVILA